MTFQSLKVLRGQLNVRPQLFGLVEVLVVLSSIQIVPDVLPTFNVLLAWFWRFSCSKCETPEWSTSREDPGMFVLVWFTRLNL